ncbi:MAG: FtsX-like permease family protein [Ruminococcaceae bacterium]|nr:FtsX-like permease family protein [Oscillospiraceae bacterium]
MKLSSIRYLIKEGVKNTWTNRLMTIASVGVLVACMVIIGVAIMISENVNMAMGNLEKQNVVMAYMQDYSWALYGNGAEAKGNSSEKPDKNGVRPSDYVIHNEQEAKALCDKIAAIPNVDTVTFVSSAEGLETATKSMLENQKQYFTFLEGEGENPLSCAAKVAMKDMELFDQTVKEIQKLEGIDVIQSNSGLAEKLAAIKQGITVAGVWIIAILMIISLVIVSNTIRVTMYTRKLEISIMKAVGATDSFVRIPFVVEGMLIGIISALFAEGLLYFCYRIATETIIKTFGDVVPFGTMVWELLLIFLAIGVVSGIIGSVIIISKYLRKEGSEFAAI